MAYDPDLAQRVRAALGGRATDERQMFGGLAFLLGGHLAVGVSGQGGLMVRVDPAQTEQLLAEPGAEPFEMRGRAMAGWLRVTGAPLDDDRVLQAWVDRGAAFAGSLPPKG